MLGVLKAGCAYLTMDPRYPAERLAFMLEDSGTTTLLTRQLDQHGLPQVGRERRLDLHTLLDVDPAPCCLPEVVVAPEDRCYVLYTSGSTGQPKGIEVRHRGVSNNVADLNERFGVGPGDRVLAVSSLSFDMSVYEILGCLAAGAAVVLPDPRQAQDPEHLATEIERQRVTIWSSAPALLTLLLDALDDQDPRLRRIRLTLLSGDWIPVRLPDRLRALAPKTRVVSLGGAAEASVYSTLYEIGRVDPAWRSIPYGRPMANQRVYVLDDDRQPVPVGMTGELYLAGVGLARGYLNRPSLTAEKFVEDPFQDAGRMYRTGDRARWLPDGTLELLGRLDAQVKINGLRIELAEIEAALKHAPEVEDAVVAVGEAPSGSPQIVAYVVARGEGFNPATLRARVGRELPHFMVPGLVVEVTELPLLPSGKIDRKSLRTRVATGAHRESADPPSNELERTWLHCWGQVLQLDGIGVHDNFFALGGDSVACIQLVTVARRAGISCAPNDVFTWPTVAELSSNGAANRAGAVS